MSEPRAEREPEGVDEEFHVPGGTAEDRARLREEERAADARSRTAAAHRAHHQTLWVETQVRSAQERGAFDDLPGAGKPIEGLGGDHDPNWWVKKLVERENITVLPPALALRVEDAELDAVLDRETSEPAVRKHVEDFNRRVVEARRQLQGGPPVITRTRDVDEAVAAWRTRRQERRRALREAVESQRRQEGERPRRRWRRG